MKMAVMAAATLVVASPAMAQGRVDGIMAQMQETMISALENSLQTRTGEGATIIYVKKLPGVFTEARYCGIARIGGKRQRFVADMSENLLLIEPSQRVWTEASCETNPPYTTVLRDLR